MSDQPPVFLLPEAPRLLLIQPRKSEVTIKSGQTLIKYLQTHSYAASESSSIIACHAATFLSPDTKHISLSPSRSLDWGQRSPAFLNYKLGPRNVPRGRLDSPSNPSLVHY